MDPIFLQQIATLASFGLAYFVFYRFVLKRFKRFDKLFAIGVPLLVFAIGVGIAIWAYFTPNTKNWELMMAMAILMIAGVPVLTHFVAYGIDRLVSRSK
jgi:hypothetical protein